MDTAKPESAPQKHAGVKIETMQITLIGDTSLISHAWSPEARAAMLAKQVKKAQDKTPKDPEKQFRDSLYEHPDGGYGYPSAAFKKCAVSACRFVKALKMTEARGAFHVEGEMVKIVGEPTMREDMVRLQGQVADIRFRGEFREWRVTLTITYNRGTISPDQLVHLFNHGGFGVGIGDWRPEKSGSHGMFHVATKEELDALG